RARVAYFPVEFLHRFSCEQISHLNFGICSAVKRNLCTEQRSISPFWKIDQHRIQGSCIAVALSSVIERELKLQRIRFFLGIPVVNHECEGSKDVGETFVVGRIRQYIWKELPMSG